jgi:hypothetical protein
MTTSGYCEEIMKMRALQRVLKKLHSRRGRQVGSATITTPGEEVKISRLLITDTLAVHVVRGYTEGNVLPSPVPKGEGPGAPATPR